MPLKTGIRVFMDKTFIMVYFITINIHISPVFRAGINEVCMKKNDFGYTWWGKKWLDSLASVDFSNRLPRGRRYARNGSVRSIVIKNGAVKAKVKGSWMYTVEINAPVFTDKEKNININITARKLKYQYQTVGDNPKAQDC
jgi:hypothetical protein